MCCPYITALNPITLFNNLYVVQIVGVILITTNIWLAYYECFCIIYILKNIFHLLILKVQWHSTSCMRIWEKNFGEQNFSLHCISPQDVGQVLRLGGKPFFCSAKRLFLSRNFSLKCSSIKPISRYMCNLLYIKFIQYFIPGALLYLPLFILLFYEHVFVYEGNMSY